VSVFRALSRVRLRPLAFVAVAQAAALTITLLAVSPAVSGEVSDIDDSTVAREPLRLPEDVGNGLLDGLDSPDPADRLVIMDAPDAASDGSAHLTYPIAIPKGRDQPGTTPDLDLTYDSEGGSGWVGLGWSLGVGEISVDTTFGVPRFCPRNTPPACGDIESESYRLDGELLAPSAIRSKMEPRISERQDFTRKVETTYDHIIRHGDNPKNYYWERRDKMGNVYWYGGYPDGGGNTGTSSVQGTTTQGPHKNDQAPFCGMTDVPAGWTGLGPNKDQPPQCQMAPSAILSDDNGNGFTWYLKAQRDIYANSIR
jgi:hypothetical protein